MSVMERLAGFRDGDEIRVRFEKPVTRDEYGPFSEMIGSLQIIVGRFFLVCSSLRQRFGLPTIIDLQHEHPSDAERLRTKEDINAERAAVKRGALHFTWTPETAEEIEEQLDILALEVLRAEGRPDDPLGRSRASQLMLQFHDVADLVALAKRKRTYLLKRAEMGRDFHPWCDPEPSIFRIETHRPLPCDLNPDPTMRKDRNRRLDEAVRIYGEAEREVRRLASFLRGQGCHVRRPHPDAQELLLRMDIAGKMVGDLTVKVSHNGQWVADYAVPDRKARARMIEALRRRGAAAVVQAQIDEFLGKPGI